MCLTHESWVKFDSTLTQMSRVRVESTMNIKDMSRVRVESCWSSFESELSQLDTARVKVKLFIFLKINFKVLHLSVGIIINLQCIRPHPPPPPPRSTTFGQIRQNVISLESDLTYLWLKWVESELSQVSKFGIWVELELSIKKSKVLSWVRVESSEMSHDSESNQTEKSESSTTLLVTAQYK